MAPAVLLNLVDSWGTGFDRSDHSLISSSSLHFPGILDIDICCCSYIYDCIHSPWFRPLRPTAGGRNQVRVFRLRLIWVWVHTDMWRTSDHVVWLSEVRSEKSGETYHLPWPCIIIYRIPGSCVLTVHWEEKRKWMKNEASWSKWSNWPFCLWERIIRKNRWLDDAIFLVYVSMYNVMVRLPLDNIEDTCLTFLIGGISFFTCIAQDTVLFWVPHTSPLFDALPLNCSTFLGFT